ncbi:hypothetical protein [Ruegeria sp. SCP11]|uniref:hypothetical protein n=1 Tax=Ruegeria sp. SCP11 TaxID=3141378 RepID=UPI00333AB1DA
MRLKFRRFLAKLLGRLQEPRTPLGFKNDFRRTELSLEIADPDHFPFGSQTRFYDAPIKINQNVCRLRHGLGRIEDAISYLEMALEIGPDSVAGKALIEASYIKYASCFTDGKTSPNFNQKHVFSDKEDLDAHDRVIYLRDKFLVHSSELAVEWQTMIAVDSDGNIFDTPTMLVKRNEPYKKCEVMSLHLLMVKARERLMENVSVKMEWALTQAQKDGVEDLPGPFTEKQLFERLKDKI